MSNSIGDLLSKINPNEPDIRGFEVNNPTQAQKIQTSELLDALGDTVRNLGFGHEVILDFSGTTLPKEKMILDNSPKLT